MRHILLAIGLAFLSALPAYASRGAPTYIASQIPEMERVGSGRMRYMMWDVCDAVLYAKKGRWKNGQPLALSLTYLQPLIGSKIAQTSIEQIRAQGFSDEKRLAIWGRQMKNIFPDVEEGTNLTGIFNSQGETVFYRDGRKIGLVRDREFGKWFFGIWLNRDSVDSELRAKLLGSKTAAK